MPRSLARVAFDGEMYGMDPRHHSHSAALSGLEWTIAIDPGALPRAGMARPVGANLIESTLEDRTDD